VHVVRVVPPSKDRRLVGQRDPGVDVEHLRAGLDLCERVGGHGREVAGRHLGRQRLPSGRIDPLAGDDEPPLEPDRDLPRRARQDGVGHADASCR